MEPPPNFKIAMTKYPSDLKIGVYWQMRPSLHVIFITKRDSCPPVKLHETHISQANDVKYLGMWIDVLFGKNTYL